MLRLFGEKSWVVPEPFLSYYSPRPENLTQLRVFLAMINYHGKFIRNLSSILQPLQPLNQLRQGSQEFKWSPSARRHLKRQRTHFHLQMYWFIMTKAFLLFLRATKASMALEQSYFTVSLMVKSDLSPVLPGP